MDDQHGTLEALASLAKAMGVLTHYIDGLDRPVDVAPETLVRVCAALGADIARPSDAPEALRARRVSAVMGHLPPVLIAWDGVVSLEALEGKLFVGHPLPFGHHRLTVEAGGRVETSTVISAGRSKVIGTSLRWSSPGIRSTGPGMSGSSPVSVRVSLRGYLT